MRIKLEEYDKAFTETFVVWNVAVFVVDVVSLCESVRHCLWTWLSPKKPDSLSIRWCVSNRRKSSFFAKIWNIVSKRRVKTYKLVVISRGWRVCSSAAQWLRRDPYFKSGDPGFKPRSTTSWVVRVVPGSTPQLCLYVVKWSSFR